MASNWSRRHGLLLGGDLDLDDAARAREDEIGVGLGAAVLDIVEIEHGRAADDAAGHRRHRLAQGQLGQSTRFDQLRQGAVQGDIGAGDRGGARAAVGLEHVAVEDHLALAQRVEPGDGAQRAADQALDLLGAAGLLAAGGLARGAGIGRARQHPVLGRDPALAGVAQERRHPLLDRRHAQDMRVPELDEAGALGMAGDVELEAHRAHLVVGAAGRAHVGISFR